MSQRAIAYVETITPILTESEALVAMAIAHLCDDATDVAEATIAQLAALAGRKERCVRYCLRALEGHGLLVRDYQPAGYVIAKTFYHFAHLERQPPPPRSEQSVHNINDAIRRRAQITRDHNAAMRSRMLAWKARSCEGPPGTDAEHPTRVPAG